MRAHGVWAGGCVAAGLVTLLAVPLTERLPGSPISSYVAGFCAVTAQIVAASGLRARVPPGRLGLELLPGALALVCLIALDGRVGAPAAAGITLGLLLLCTSLGAGLGRRIEQPGHVLAVALVSGLVDVWSVFDPAGPSAKLSARVLAEPEALSALVLAFPALGSGTPMPLIGAGDVVFSALYAAALARHGVDARRGLSAIALGYVLGMLTTILLARSIPLLPFMGAAVLTADRRLCSLGARDRRTLAVSVGLILVWLAVRIAR
jgi:hypothetical protein